MPDGQVLDVRDLRVSFRTRAGTVKAVDGLSLHVGPGEVLGIVGESGSGKSVAMYSILGLVRDANATVAGEARFDGRDLLALSNEELRRVRGRQVAMIFQDPMTALTPVFRIGWQIAEQVRAHTGVSRREAGARAVELLGEVGIPDPVRRAQDYPHELSGGMRQRVVIAMALSCNPRLLIADEPTTALDVTTQAQILDLVRKLMDVHGSSVVLITHDMGVVSEMADRVVVMYAGRAVEDGTRREVLRDPQHPYTWGLLGAVPRVDGRRKERLATIPGSSVSPLNLPPGCAFAPRCGARLTRCDETPVLVGDHGHRAACWIEPVDRPRLREAVLTAARAPGAEVDTPDEAVVDPMSDLGDDDSAAAASEDNDAVARPSGAAGRGER